MRKFAVIHNYNEPPIIIEAYTYKFNQGKLDFYDNQLNWVTTVAPKGWLQIYEVKADESKSAEKPENYDDSWAYEHNPCLHGYTDKG